jgi:predicted double-glycine peptidase
LSNVTRRQLIEFSTRTTLLGGLATLALPGIGCAVKTTHSDAFKEKYKGFRYCSVDAVKQSEQLSCGAAALTSVLNYWKEDEQPAFDEKELIRDNPARSDEGYPLLQLREMALDRGFAAFAVTLNEDPWKQLFEHVDAGRPVIAAIDCPRGRYFGKKVPLVETLDRRAVMSTGNEWKSHYVVVMGRNYSDVLFMDPEYGIVRTRRGDFLSFWRRQNYAALICSSA